MRGAASRGGVRVGARVGRAGRRRRRGGRPRAAVVPQHLSHHAGAREETDADAPAAADGQFQGRGGQPLVDRRHPLGGAGRRQGAGHRGGRRRRQTDAAAAHGRRRRHQDRARQVREKNSFKSYFKPIFLVLLYCFFSLIMGPESSG